MATLSFDQTNRVATVLAPDTQITIQEVYNQFVDHEDNTLSMAEPQHITAGGKFNYGTGAFTVVSIKLLDGWQIAFEARPGPTLVGCEIQGGNLTSETALGAPQWPISHTDYVSVSFAQATTGALLEGVDVAELTALNIIQKMLTNRKVTDPVGGTMTIYDDDDVTPLFTAPIWEDATQTQRYRGKGLEEQERLQ